MSYLYLDKNKYKAGAKGILYKGKFFPTTANIGTRGLLLPLSKAKVSSKDLFIYQSFKQQHEFTDKGNVINYSTGSNSQLLFTQIDGIPCMRFNLSSNKQGATVQVCQYAPKQQTVYTTAFSVFINAQQFFYRNKIFNCNSIWYLYIQNNKLVFRHKDSSDSIQLDFKINCWFTVVVTCTETSRYRLYIDGVLQGTLNTQTNAQFVDYMYFGGSKQYIQDKVHYGGSFAGAISNFKLYNRLLSAQQLSILSSQSKNNFAFVSLRQSDQPLVQNTKGIVLDKKQNSSTTNLLFHAAYTISLGDTVNGSNPSFKAGYSIVYDDQRQTKCLSVQITRPQTQSISYPNTKDLFSFGKKDFTIAFWLKPTSVWYQHNPIIMNTSYGDSYTGFAIYRNRDANSRCIAVRLLGGGDFYSKTEVSTQWQHWVLVRRSDKIYWYLNGVLDTQQDCSANIVSSKDFQLAGNYNNWNSFTSAHFRISDLYVFSRGLQDVQIQDLYNGVVKQVITYPFIPVIYSKDKFPVDYLALYHPLKEALTQLPTKQSVTEQVVSCYTVQNNIPCKFFGNNSYITLNNPSGSYIPVLSRYQCTITFWAKCIGDTGVQLDFGQGQGSNNRNNICVFWHRGLQYLGVKDNNYLNPQIDVDPAKWYFYCIRYNANTGNIQLRIDNQTASTTSYWNTSPWTAIQYFSIGAQRTIQTQSWPGYIAGLRIYNKYLEDSDISLLKTQFTPDYTQVPQPAHTLSDSSLVLYADMRKADKIPTGQTVTINGYQCYRTIANLPCFWFGADTRYDLTTQKLPTGYTAFTVSAWFYTCFDDDKSWQNIWNMGDSSRTRYRNSQFYIYSNRTVGPHFGNGAYQNFVQTSNKYQWQKWQHAVMTYDKCYAKFYINGQLIYSNYRALNLNTVLFNMGTEPGNIRDSKYKGYISDVRVYSRAITQTQVQTLYNMHKDAVQDKKLLFHLKCDSFKAQTGQDILKDGRDNYYTVNLVTQDGIPAYQFPSGYSYNCAIIQQTYNFPYGDNIPFTVAAWSKLPQKPNNYLGVFSLGIKTSGWQYTKQLCISWQWPVQRFKFCYYDIDKRQHGNLLTSWDYRPAWYHTLATYDGSILSIYTNNVLTVEKEVNIHTQPRYMMLGRLIHDDNSHYKNGFISDVRVYNKSLSKAQATQVYNYQKPTDVAQLYTKQEHLIIHTPLDGFMPRQALTGQQYTPVKYRTYVQLNHKDCLQIDDDLTIPDTTVYSQLTVSIYVYLQGKTQTINIISIGDLQLNIQSSILSLKKGTQSISVEDVVQDGWQLLNIMSKDMKTFDLYLGTYKVLSKTFTESLSTYEVTIRKTL